MCRHIGRLALLLVFVFSPLLLHGQTANGTVLGTVTDASGLVVPNASVTVTNVGTNVASHVTTGSGGTYSVPNLIPGQYQVTIEVTGFKAFVASKLTLLVDQKLRVDAVLQPGAVTTRVEVTGVAQLVDTDSSAIGKVVENKQIVDLPLLTRNFLGLASLSPGTMADPGHAFGTTVPVDFYTTNLGGGALWVAGGRSTSNQYLIDGVDDNNPGFQSPGVTPPIDAIQEFKMMSQNYSAEFGGSAAQVNIAIKSGTNSFHGTAYEFFRNDVLDARSFFDVTNPLTGKSKAQLRYNQFGGTIGGPIKRDKWFFFGNYEGVREVDYAVQKGNFPTPAQLSGNYAGFPPIYDPVTKAQFPENIIPSGRISSKAKQVIGYGLFVTPNVPQMPGYNTVDYLTSTYPIDQAHVRVDGRLSAKDTLFVRSSYQEQNVAMPGVTPLSGYTQIENGRNVVIGYNRLFSPNMINDFRVSFSRPYTSYSNQAGLGDIAGALFTGTDRNPTSFGAPMFTFSGYGTSLLGVGTIGTGPLNYITNSWEFVDGLTYMRGKHSLKMGVNIRRFFYKENNAYGVRGMLSFNGQFTAGTGNSQGDGIADFLLGLPTSASVTQGVNNSFLYGRLYNFYMVDDYKVSPRLTLNLGLRYEFRAPMPEENDQASIFDPSYPGGRVLSPNRPIVTQVNSPLLGYTPYRGLERPDWTNFAPRVGFAYRPSADNRTVVRGAYGIFYDTYEFNEADFSHAGPPWQKSVSLVATLQNPINMDTLFPVAPTAAPVAGQISMFSLNPNNRTPYIQQWNLDVQRELASGWVLDVGYLGSKGTRLHQREDPIQWNLAASGPLVDPYYNFSAVLLDSTSSKSTYNALTARMEKRFSRGLYVEGHYTWSKTLSTGSEVSNCAQNYWNRNADYGPVLFDAKHRAVFSGIWDLPFGRGKRFGSSTGGAANKLVGGWQLNGIYIIQGGSPFSVSATNVSGMHHTYSSSRANLIGDPSAVDPVDPTRAFNRYAFAQPAPGTYGNSGVGILRGKILNNADLSFFKNTYVKEGVNLQFRAECFNAFNHTQLGPWPGRSYNLTPSAAFGVYSTLNHGPRIVQLAMKVIF